MQIPQTNIMRKILSPPPFLKMEAAYHIALIATQNYILLLAQSFQKRDQIFVLHTHVNANLR